MSYCHRCDRWFTNRSALSQHSRDSPKHSKRYACTTCNRTFATYAALQNHNEASHYYCRSCDRHFSSSASLARHLASSIHTPRWLACPARKCSKAFCAVSGLLHHAESNTCPSGVTRKTVNKYVAKIDRQNVITNPARMIAVPGGVHHPPKEPNYIATERSWNGSGFECFLCYSTFQSLDGLNQHLKSPRHLQRVYHCPMRGCNKEFTVVSALCQHVERGSCGIRQTRMIETALQNLTRGMRALTF